MLEVTFITQWQILPGVGGPMLQFKYFLNIDDGFCVDKIKMELACPSRFLADELAVDIGHMVELDHVTPVEVKVEVFTRIAER
jgi:hypothetical protein